MLLFWEIVHINQDWAENMGRLETPGPGQEDQVGSPRLVLFSFLLPQ